MRSIDCRNARREIEETSPGDQLSLAVSAHLESCVACQTLSREQSRLQTIISSLGTVEAPGDFDFRLRARLAGERNGSARPFGLGDFSFGFRSAAVAMVLLAIGAAFLVFAFRMGAGDAPVASVPTPAAGADANRAGGVKAGGTEDVASKENIPKPVEAVPGSQEETQKRRPGKGELAVAKARSIGTRELSSTRAPVFTANDEAPNSYPTAAFPIDASYQSLKMSVDNGRGTSRTISLPTVSFGSQQTLSQSTSALAVPARGAW